MNTEPRWWKYLFPRYGNWGGPGWSCGRWCPPGVVDWEVKPVDAMDELFRAHDWNYQLHKCRHCADEQLIDGLRFVNVKGVWPNTYRIGALIGFWIRCKMTACTCAIDELE